MSSQKGNTSRTRAQKYKNSTGFRNDLHDKTPKVKLLNSLSICNVCERCKNILEWKIKYKKYKPLTAAKTCTKCNQKSVRHAYHILCRECAGALHLCPRCGKEPVTAQSAESPFQLDRDMQQALNTLPERRRRTFLRFLHAKQTAPDPGVDVRCELAKLAALQVHKDELGSDEPDSDEEDDEEP